MKDYAIFTCLAIILLSGCVDQGLSANDFLLKGQGSRFSIESYHRVDGINEDLTGLWIAIHDGLLTETMDGVDYEISGYIREIVEIREQGGSYYLRSCLESNRRQPITMVAENVSFIMNGEQVDLINSGNTLMSGTAAHDSANSSYTGTLAMKKVASLDDSFGQFDYYNASDVNEPASASCFQEGYLHVVGSKLFVSQWSDVEVFSVAQWSGGDAFKQTGYLLSRDGSADAVRELKFIEGMVAVDNTTRQYTGVTVTTDNASVNAYSSSFAVSGGASGSIDLSFNIGSEGTGSDYTAVDAGDVNGGSNGYSWWDWGSWNWGSWWLK